MELVVHGSRCRPAIPFILGVASLLVSRAMAFSITVTNNFGKKRQLNFRRFSHLPEGAERKNGVVQPTGIRTQESTDGLTFSNREYWLDLRGTAIFPRQALDFLQQQVALDDIQDLVDRIVVTQDVFDKLIDSTAKEMDLFYITNDQQLAVSRHETQQSFVAGKILTCQSNSVLDPLAAMEINSNGGWVVIDSEEADHQEESVDWMEEQVTSLLSFLSSTATASATTTSDSGLFLPTLSADGDDAASTSVIGRGGIAVSCPNKNTLLQMDFVLTKSCSDMMITTTTDSGILLPTGMSNRKSPPLATALLLPFDALLWKTAFDLRILQEEQDDDI